MRVVRDIQSVFHKGAMQYGHQLGTWPRLATNVLDKTLNTPSSSASRCAPAIALNVP